VRPDFVAWKIESAPFLTSYLTSESDTLDTVCNRDAATTENITVGRLMVDASSPQVILEDDSEQQSTFRGYSTYLRIATDTGEIRFDDNNLITTGAFDAGAITGTSLTDSTATLTSGALTGLTTLNAATGIIKTTSGTISTITDNSTNWNTAYTHSQDNTQAHTDYLINNGADTTSGRLTAAGLTATGGNTIILETASGTNRNPAFSPTSAYDNIASLDIYPSSGTNVKSSFSVIPRGTGFSATNKAGIGIYNTDYVDDSTNFEALYMRAMGTKFTIFGVAEGSGTARPMHIGVSNAENTDQLILHPGGNVSMDEGNVAIGHQSPGAELDIDGSTIIQGDSNSGNLLGFPTLKLTNAHVSTGAGDYSFVGVAMCSDNDSMIGEFFADGSGIFNGGTSCLYFRATTNHPMLFGTNNTERMRIESDGVVHMKQSLKIQERASAPSDTAGYGQLWIKNTTPCELWYTNDAGTDTQIV